MKRRKIWANLSTAVLMAAPAAASASTLTDRQPAAIEAKADQGRIHLAQHQGHGGAAVKASPAARVKARAAKGKAAAVHSSRRGCISPAASR
jgi:hypothetical protein